MILTRKLTPNTKKNSMYATLPVGAVQNIQQVCLPTTGESLKDIACIRIRESIELLYEALNYLLLLLSAQKDDRLIIKCPGDRTYIISVSHYQGDVTVVYKEYIPGINNSIGVKLVDLVTNEINMNGLLWLADCLENAKAYEKTTLYRV